jgi:hypothetical protein
VQKGGNKTLDPKAGTRGGKPLTRGQLAFRKLLASVNKSPGITDFCKAISAMEPTCVPTPLANHDARFAPAAMSGVSSDQTPPLCFQFSFEMAEGVPHPGARFAPTARTLHACLFDVFHMRFVGMPRRLPLVVPNDKDKSKQDAMYQWKPDKSADSTFVSAALGGEEQLHLYLELQQTCQVRGSEFPSKLQHVSCGYALLPLKDLTAPAAGSRWGSAGTSGPPPPPTGKRELSVSGGTPFNPRAIEKGQLPGGKSFAGMLKSVLASKGPMTKMVLKFEKPDKLTLQIAQQQQMLPPNSVCPAVSAVAFAHYHAMLASSKRGALQVLFQRAASASDPVLALFPKLLRDAETMQHFNAVWKQRVDRLGSKDKEKPEVRSVPGGVLLGLCCVSRRITRECYGKIMQMWERRSRSHDKEPLCSYVRFFTRTTFLVLSMWFLVLGFGAQVLQQLVRDCTLAVWPLLQMTRVPESTRQEETGRRGSMGLDRQEASVRTYMEGLSKAKGSKDMPKIIAGETKGSQMPLLFQPFCIDEFVDV